MAGTDRAAFKSKAATDRSAQADPGGWRPAAGPATFFALSAALAAICALATFNRATTPWSTLPDNDYWSNVTGLITADGVKLTLGNLFRHNNEHIIVIPKLVYAANYWLTSGSNIGLIVYSLALGAACTALLLWLALPLFRDAPIRMMLCAVLFPLAMFSAKLSHSYFLGMSGTIWLTADLFVILSAAALARAVVEQSASWLLAALLATLLGVLSYSTAVYSLLTLLIACVALLLVPRLRGAMSWAVPAAMACAVLLVLVLGAAYRNVPPRHPAWSFDLVELAHFVLLYIGTALASGHLRWIAGLAILAAGSAAILRVTRERQIGETLAWIVLFFYAPFNGLMTAIGRLGLGSEMASSSRYQSVTAISLIATIRLVLAALPNGRVSRRASVARGAVVAALIAVAVVLAANRAFVRTNVARNEGKAIAEIALRQGIQGQHHLKVVTPVIVELENMLPELRASQHAPFHWQSACEELLGTRLPATSGPASGTVESLTDYPVWHGTARAIELTGWAEQGGSEADCVVIVDGTRTVIGAGASVSERPDIERAKGATSLGPIGWKAVATMPLSTPICALALFPDDIDNDGPWEPLDNCQESIESAAVPAPAAPAGDAPEPPRP